MVRRTASTRTCVATISSNAVSERCSLFFVSVVFFVGPEKHCFVVHLPKQQAPKEQACLNGPLFVENEGEAGYDHIIQSTGR
jgi:hypothetical protein